MAEHEPRFSGGLSVDLTPPKWAINGSESNCNQNTTCQEGKVCSVPVKLVEKNAYKDINRPEHCQRKEVGDRPEFQYQIGRLGHEHPLPD